MHVTIAWDHKPLLLLATALLPNRTTGTPTSRGKASISFGSTFRRFVLTLRGYLNSWLVLTAVLPWTGALVFLMEKYITCREMSLISGTPWCSRTFIT